MTTEALHREPSPISLRRDAPSQFLRRMGAVRSFDAEKRTAVLSLSSETPVMRWGDSEILLHGADNVDLVRLQTVGAFHIDHDTTKPVAAITRAWVEKRELMVEIRFGRTAIAEDAWKNLQDGIYRGVSVGYNVDAWAIDEKKREYRATKWTPFEGSFTTIPADPTVGVGREAEAAAWRSLTASANPPISRQKPGGESSMDKFKKWLQARGLDYDTLTQAQRDAFQADYDAINRAAPPAPAPAAPVAVPTGTGDEAARAAELADLRKQNLHLTMRNLATSHGVTLTDEEVAAIATRENGQDMVLRKVAAKQATIPTGTAISMGRDATDKTNEAIEDGLLDALNPGRMVDGKATKDLGMRMKSPLAILRRAVGPSGYNLNNDELAKIGCRVGLDSLSLRDANQSAANFAVILNNVANKLVMDGWGRVNITHRLWTVPKPVTDFKTFYETALVSGLLGQQVSKGDVATEMNFGEKSWNSQLGLFHKTATFTYQDWRNDNLGQFAQALMGAGELAARTEDWQVYKTLLAMAWTGYTGSSSAVYDSTNQRYIWDAFDVVLAAVADRTVSANGESTPLMAMVDVILAPNKRAGQLEVVAGSKPSNFVSDAVVQPRANAPTVIASPWLANSALTGYSADNYYAFDRRLAPIAAITDALQPGPQVMEISAGATPDRKYYIQHHFAAAERTKEGSYKAVW